MSQEFFAVIKLLIYAALKGMQYNEAYSQLRMHVLVQAVGVG